MDQKEKFMTGNASLLLVWDIMFGAGISAVPNGSLTIFLINMAITIIGMGLAFYWWKVVPSNIRYNSLVAFVMFISFGFFLVTPLLRLMFDSMLFLPVTLLYLFVLGYTLFKRELIFQAFHRPGDSKIALGVVLFLFILLIIGSFTARNGQDQLLLRLLNDHQGAFLVSSLLYGIGLFFSFVSSAMLKKPEEIKS